MSRKQKWKGVPLNNKNIDEYMDDLYADTKGQYITQGVSFNKDDNFQMNLLKNALLSHGSFSGFVKHLMYNYFEKNNRLDESIWIPNSSEDSPPLAPIQEPEPENNNHDEQATGDIQEPLAQDNESNIKEQDNPPVPPAPPQDESSGEQKNNNQRGGQRPKLRGGGSLSKAILEQKN